MIGNSGWADSWQDFESIAHLAQKVAVECVETPGCIGEGSGGLEYTGGYSVYLYLYVLLSCS